MVINTDLDYLLCTHIPAMYCWAHFKTENTDYTQLTFVL
jgi:hypothetical protein